MHDEGPTTLTLRDCSLGEECGRLERIDDNGEHCVYKLEYRSEEADVFNFKAVTANSFGCGYSPWASRVMHLSRVTDDIVMVIAGGVATTSTTLKRAGS